MSSRIPHAVRDRYESRMRAASAIVRARQADIERRYGSARGAGADGLWLPYHHVGHNIAVGDASTSAGLELAERGEVEILDVPVLHVASHVHDDVQDLPAPGANEHETGLRLMADMERHPDDFDERDRILAYDLDIATRVLGFHPVVRKMSQNVDLANPLTWVITDKDVISIVKPHGVRDGLRLLYERLFPLRPSARPLLGPDGNPVARPKTPRDLAKIPLPVDIVREHLRAQQAFCEEHEFMLSSPSIDKGKERNADAWTAMREHFDHAIGAGMPPGDAYFRLLVAADRYARSGELPVSVIPEASLERTPRIRHDSAAARQVAHTTAEMDIDRPFGYSYVNPDQRRAIDVRSGNRRAVHYEVLDLVEGEWGSVSSADLTYRIDVMTGRAEEPVARKKMLATMKRAVTRIERLLDTGMSRGPHSVPTQIGLADAEGIARLRQMVEGLAQQTDTGPSFLDKIQDVSVTGEMLAREISLGTERAPDLDVVTASDPSPDRPRPIDHDEVVRVLMEKATAQAPLTETAHVDRSRSTTTRRAASPTRPAARRPLVLSADRGEQTEATARRDMGSRPLLARNDVDVQDAEEHSIGEQSEIAGHDLPSQHDSANDIARFEL